MTLGVELVGYKQIRVTDELCGSVQRANGMPLRQHQTLGELVSIMTALRGICGPEDLISEERTRHEVRVDGRVLYTFCFVDALMLPSLLRGAPVEVWSTSPYLNAFPSRSKKHSTSRGTGPRLPSGIRKEGSAVAEVCITRAK